MENSLSHDQKILVGRFYLELHLHYYGESVSLFVSRILSMKQQEIEPIIISILVDRLLDDQRIIQAFGSQEFLLNLILRSFPSQIDSESRKYFLEVDKNFSRSLFSQMTKTPKT